MSSWSIVQSNLTSVTVLVFIVGFIGSRFKSDLLLPEQVYQFVSLYLLFGIGLKGGVELRGSEASSIVLPALATLSLGVLIPILAFMVLRLLTKIGELDRGAIAAHYGSTSLVTFSAALTFLESSGIKYEGFAATLLTLMEIPGIVVGIYLGSRHLNRGVSWAESLKEIVFGKTILLLAGGLVVGLISGSPGYEKVTPFFVALLPGFLALFLLHLGYLAGSHVWQIREAGWKYIVFAIAFPILAGTIGVLAGNLAGLSVGGATILGVLCASASYIAAPAAVGIALPEASKSLPIMASLGVTFPFNLIVGIPYLYWLALQIGG